MFLLVALIVILAVTTRKLHVDGLDMSRYS